jgi:hypothetical protein
MPLFQPSRKQTMQEACEEYTTRKVTETSTIPASMQATFKDFVRFNRFTAEHILACFVPDCRVPYGSFHV